MRFIGKYYFVLFKTDENLQFLQLEKHPQSPFSHCPASAAPFPSPSPSPHPSPFPISNV